MDLIPEVGTMCSVKTKCLLFGSRLSLQDGFRCLVDYLGSDRVSDTVHKKRGCVRGGVLSGTVVWSEGRSLLARKVR